MRALIAILFKLICLLGLSQNSLAKESSFGFNVVGPKQDHVSLKIKNYLFDVTEKMPVQMKDGIHQSVAIEFREMRVSVKEVLGCSPKDAHVVAFSEVSMLEGIPKIVIARELLNILDSDSSRNQASCHHQTAYGFLLATTLHELAHIYDGTIPFPAAELYERMNCINSPEFATTHYENCQKALNAQGRVSESSYYRNMTGWKSRDQLHSVARSPDIYEFTNIREHFAVNFEYYILDSEFPCRRPHTFEIFKTIFKETKPAVCKENLKVFNEDAGVFQGIKAGRIFEIDYLQAGPGSASMSRWGHAMFRLIICDEKRTLVDRECRQDINSHLIVGFGAQTNEGYFDNLKGITGRYASKISVLNFSKQAAKYTSDELRNLVSRPLRLTGREKELFVKALLQEYWEYRGRYEFLNNNCATESYRFLRMVLNETSGIQRGLYLTPTTPNDFKNILIKANLIDADLIANNESDRLNGYFFPSKLEVLKTAFSQMSQTNIDFDSYVKLSAGQRRQLFERIDLDMRKTAASLLLERWIGKSAQSIFLEKAVMLYKKSGREFSIANPETYYLKESHGYGIPFEYELSDPEQLQVKHQQTNSTMTTLADTAAKVYSAEYRELMDTKSNLIYLQSKLSQKAEN